MKVVFIYLFFGLMFLSDYFFAQPENKVWYFGHHAGLNFNTNPPTPLTNAAMYAFEGSSSIASSSGSLLFYTNSMKIFDQTHSVMANGNGLRGDISTTQSSLILKQPGHQSLYYLFTLQDSYDTLSYSVIDMSLAAGNGSVVTKNVFVFDTCIEKLSAVQHCNGRDFWIVSHEALNNRYRANLLTPYGFDTNTVKSDIGMSVYGGYLKFSPNGKKMGSALYTNLGGCELYDFDRSTGSITNLLSLNTGSVVIYGCEFSPDGTKFYGSGNGKIFQWDLCAGSPAAIAASCYSFAIGGFSSGMQLAPDGQIYVSMFGSSSLDAIANPNASGNGMNYTPNSVFLMTGIAQHGLPNHIKPEYRPATPNPFTYAVNGNLVCRQAAFTLQSLGTYTNYGCVASGYSVTNCSWNFGDPSTGTNNVSNLNNPTHLFSTQGIYTVTVIVDYSCGGITDTLVQQVIIGPCISISSSSVTCASPGSATVYASGPAGPYSYTWTPSSQTGSVATGLGPGSYTVTLYDAGANLTYTASTTLISSGSFFGNVIHSDSISCHGANTATAEIINLTGGSGNQTFLWINPSAISYTSQIVSLSAGLWSVTVTDAVTGCQINQAFFISQPPPLNLNLSASSTTACVNNPVILTGINSGGTPFSNSPSYTYSWTDGLSDNTRTVSESNPGAHTYTLHSVDAKNCVTTKTIGINFIARPFLSVSTISICPLAVGVLTVTGATTYTWLSSSGFSTSASSFSDAPVATKQYTVIGNALGCTSSTCASIVLKSTPSTSLSSNSPRCDGESLTLNCTSGNSFLWSGPNNFNSYLQNPTLSSVDLTNAGVYNVTVTGANSCTHSASQTIIINPGPMLSVAGTTVCTSQTLNLFAIESGAVSFTWTGPQNFNSHVQNPSIANPVISESGNYSISATSSLGCISKASALFSVLSPPSLTTSISSNGTLCAQALNGSPSTITLTCGGAVVYTLETPASISNSALAGFDFQLSSVQPYISGNATATVTGSNGFCSSSTLVVFTVIPNPVLSPLTPTPTICSSQSFTYTSNGAVSYTWSEGSLNPTTYTSPVIAVSPTQTSLYSVTGGSLGCNSATQTSTLTVRPLPQFSIGPHKPAICLHEKIKITAIGNAESYTWSPNNGLSNVNGFSVNAGPVAQQTYTLLGVLNTCTSTAVITVSVLPLPKAVASVMNDKLCVNGVVKLTAGGGKTYDWEGPQDIRLTGQTTTFVASSANYSGIYVLTATDSNGCTNKASVNLTIYNLPGEDLYMSKKEACVPFTSEFRSSFSSTHVIGSWTLQNTTYNTKNFSHLFSNPGTYTISGNFKDTVTRCVNSNSFVIKANPNPRADFNILPEKPIENLDEVIFTNTSEGEQQKMWNWYFINNQGYHSKNENTSYLFSDAGIYPVALVVTNAWGCSDTIIKSLKVEADDAIYVPNIFTPDGDNLNDIFVPVSRAFPDRYQEYQLSIFDRWGAKLFSTNDPGAGWDGSFRGQECKVDVYVWKMTLSSVNGEMKTLTGHVTLSR